MPTSLTAALQPFVDRNQLAGAVALVADANKTLDVTTVGYADVENKKPMPADAMFWIASVSKPITAAAFMMLVDEGQVATDDEVQKYLPEFANMWYVAEKSDERQLLKKASRPIKLHDLLTHTSGLPFLSKSEPVIDARPLREVVVSAASAPLQADTGTQYIYSNSGTNTIGRVIEVITGMPFETFLQKRLFDPLGMTETTFFPNPSQVARLAGVYKTNEAKDSLIRGSYTQFLAPFPATPQYAAPGGGLFSTAADTAKFAQMLLRGGEADGKQLISRESVRRMTSVQSELPRDGKPNKTGYFFSTESPYIANGPSPAGPCWHGGAFANHMRIDPDKGIVTIWMVQHQGWPTIEGPSPHETFTNTANELYGQK